MEMFRRFAVHLRRVRPEDAGGFDQAFAPTLATIGRLDDDEGLPSAAQSH